MGTWTRQVTRYTCHCGWEVQVFHFTSQPLLQEIHSGEAYQYEAVPLPGKAGDLRYFLAMGWKFWKLRSRLENSDFVLEIFGESSGLKFWSLLPGFKKSIPYIFLIGCRTYEDHCPEGIFKKFRNFWYRKWMQGASIIFVDGEDIRRELIAGGIEEEKIRVLYASIDVKMYHPEVSKEPFTNLLKEKNFLFSEDPLLVYCGRLVFMNRPMDFLKIVEQIPECRAVLIGDGPDRVEIEEKMSKMNDRVVLLGYQPEEILVSAFCSATVSLFPLSSMIAGISLVVPQAMACGAAVMTNEVCDLAQLVKSGQNGILCKEGDIEGWVRATRRLLADPILRNQLGKAARTTIEKEWTESIREQEFRVWLEKLM